MLIQILWYNWIQYRKDVFPLNENYGNTFRVEKGMLKISLRIAKFVWYRNDKEYSYNCEKEGDTSKLFF